MSSLMPLNIAVVTVSDTRTAETDKSGAVLVERLERAGHQLYAKTIVKDDISLLRAEVSALIADAKVQAILLTGGTGFTARDNTCLLYTSPSPRDGLLSRMPSSA